MCGIVGFSSSLALDVRYEIMVKMTSELKHRGPDASGVWCNAHSPIVLGHTRLSIVELSKAGAQPMVSASGRYVLSFNGEIYNHLTLRNLLEADGAVTYWRGRSDTETLLTCFAAWGVQRTLKAAVGMFALALWDSECNVLTLARDRMGEKPLYWGWQGNTLLFGSELKAIKAHPEFRGEIDRNSLALLLRHNYIPAPHCIYKGIEKLSAGHYIEISFKDGCVDSRARPAPYWQMNKVVEAGIRNPFEGSQEMAVDALNSQLNLTIEQQMLSEVPLGAFLSGGIDSSTVVAIMQSISASPIQTFTIGFQDQKYNEANQANAVARHLGTSHVELCVRPSDALSIVPRLASLYCEPFADSSQIATVLVSQLARKHVTVALSGDGGDELFGGYNPYQFAPVLWRRISLLPHPIRTWLLSVSSDFHQYAPSKLRRLLYVLATSSREDFYRSLISHWSRPEKIVINSVEPSTPFSSPEKWPNECSFEEWMMAIDAQVYMADDILVKLDRAAMASSLETRVPLLDHRVVELAWRMPLEFKIRQQTGKWLLRQVLYRYVPQDLVDRPKKGFSVPLADWLRGPLREWAESLLSQEKLGCDGYFDSVAVSNKWKEHQLGVDHSRSLWSILMFQDWLEAQKN